jgi:parallel beta-helix repeat protein
MKRLLSFLILLSIATKVAANPSNPVPSGCCWSILAPTTITQSGNYRLANDIAGGLIIAADDVQIDCENKVIDGGTIGISVGAFNNVIIKNGTVRNAITNGIEATNAVNIEILQMNLESNAVGLSLTNVQDGKIENCTARENTFAGFWLQDSSRNIFKQCLAIDNGQGGTSSAYGFLSDNGRSNIFEQCNAQSTITTQTGEEFVAAGFALTGSEICTKIIECESFDNTTSTVGFAIPYGILLTYTFTAFVPATNVSHGNSVQAVEWAPNGKFLAIGGLNGTNAADVRVYAFDPDTKTLTLLASFDHGANILSVSWSPDGNFLAIGGVSGTGAVEVRVFRFDQSAGTLTSVATFAHAATVNSVDWSPDGKFLAIGGAEAVTIEIRVLRFNPTAGTLTSVADVSYGVAPANVVLSVNWSPDGNFLGAGGSGATDQVRVYAFNPNDLSTVTALTQVAMATHGNTVNSVNWSPNGKFLAIGGTAGTGTFRARIFEFNAIAPALTNIDDVNYLATVFSVNWSPDGKFLAFGGAGVDSIAAFGFSIQQQATTAAPVASQVLAANVLSVNWGPDGQFFASGQVTGVGNEIRVFDAIAFESTKNILKNNIVYCNVGNECPSGIGISGSSFANAIIGNTAYENTINYEFVTNVYNSGINGSPSILLNVSIPPF